MCNFEIVHYVSGVCKEKKQHCSTTLSPLNPANLPTALKCCLAKAAARSHCRAYSWGRRWCGALTGTGATKMGVQGRLAALPRSGDGMARAAALWPVWFGPPLASIMSTGKSLLFVDKLVN